MTALRHCRIGFCLIFLALAACGLKGAPETPEPEQAQRTERG